MKERDEATETPARKPYEEPTLVEREDLPAVTEGMVIAGISEGVPVI